MKGSTKLDFTVSEAKLAEASGQMTRARTGESQELVDLLCERDSVKFVVTGREFSCLAEVTSLGAAQIPLAMLPSLRKAAATFNGDVRIRVERGRVRVNSLSISAPEINLKTIAARMIDVPDGAPARDFLALQYLFSESEIVESNLVGRILEANAELQEALDGATSLGKFGVTRDQLRLLVQENLKVHAEAIRPLVLPS